MSRNLWIGLSLGLAGIAVVVAATAFNYRESNLAETLDQIELVIDEADLIDGAAEKRIADYHRALRRDHDIDYRVLTVRDSGDIDGYAAQAFKARNVGAASEAGHGLLLVIDPAEDVLRIEVSRSLEPTYVDAFVAYIEERQMNDFFAQNRVAEGILATTEMIVTRAQRAERNKGLKSAITEAGSAGGGAKATAQLEDKPTTRHHRHNNESVFAVTAR